jgi:hypothetical protein
MKRLYASSPLAQTDRFTLTHLCEQFGISRKTAYRHLERYAAGGLKALQLRSHGAHCIPRRPDGSIEQLGAIRAGSPEQLEVARRGLSPRGNNWGMRASLSASILPRAAAGGQSPGSAPKADGRSAARGYYPTLRLRRSAAAPASATTPNQAAYVDGSGIAATPTTCHVPSVPLPFQMTTFPVALRAGKRLVKVP